MVWSGLMETVLTVLVSEGYGLFEAISTVLVSERYGVMV